MAGIVTEHRRIDWTGIAFAAILTLCILVPLLVVGTWAFTNVWRYPSVIPQEFGLKFWGTVLARADVWSSITMSLSLATVVTFLSALICLPAAYAFARMEFPGRNILFFSFLAGSLVLIVVFVKNLPYAPQLLLTYLGLTVRERLDCYVE